MLNKLENNIFFLELDSDFRVVNSDPELENKLNKFNFESKNISDIFPISAETKEIISSRTDRAIVFLEDSNIQLTFVPNYRSEKKYGYLVEISFIEDFLIYLKNKKDNFFSEFDYVLNKLNADIALGVDFNSFFENIVKYAVKLTQANFGSIIFIEKNIKERFGPIIYPDDIWIEAQVYLNIIYSNLSKINIWFSFNRNTLFFSKKDRSIIETLADNLSDDEILYLIPVYLENSLLSAIMLHIKKHENLEKTIYKIESFSGISALYISNFILKEQWILNEKKSTKYEKTEQIIKKTNSLAHDFNNILHSTYLSFSSLKSKLENKENIAELLSTIDKNLRIALNISSDLLSIGRSKLKRKSVIKTDEIVFDLSKTLKQIIPPNIKVNYNVENNLPEFIGNETELFQMLLNLVLNSKDAIENEGNIWISASYYEKNNSFNEAPLIPAGSYIMFSVKDDGKGIPKEALPHIFDPYFTTKGKKGAGLGLSIVKDILQSHNGFIFVESEELKGTEIKCFIPTGYKRQISEFNDIKIILVVDDEEIIRNILAELLEANNYEVICASDSRQALKILKEEIKADLALIDHNMPEISGIECIKHIRKINPDLPIILTTGDVNKLDINEIYSLKIDKILEKPYDFEQVYLAIKSILNKEND